MEIIILRTECWAGGGTQWSSSYLAYLRPWVQSPTPQKKKALNKMVAHGDDEQSTISGHSQSCRRVEKLVGLILMHEDIFEVLICLKLEVEEGCMFCQTV